MSQEKDCLVDDNKKSSSLAEESSLSVSLAISDDSDIENISKSNNNSVVKEEDSFISKINKKLSNKICKKAGRKAIPIKDYWESRNQRMKFLKMNSLNKEYSVEERRRWRA